MLCREIPEERLIIGTVRAKDSVEALLRVLALGVPAAVFAEGISGVLSQRLVRKLCPACREAYVPTPQILGQLGIPEGRVQAFYRPPQQPQEVCQQCAGVGYKGRTAVFELLKVGEAVRKVLKSGPKAELLRQAARKDGLRGFQEEGVLLVAKGTTSLPELMRVLKQ
jgi:type II secretory ATPase GspE/PulE/Tfp pilus assembly ATPase PilB-like protein